MLTSESSSSSLGNAVIGIAFLLFVIVSIGGLIFLGSNLNGWAQQSWTPVGFSIALMAFGAVGCLFAVRALRRRKAGSKRFVIQFSVFAFMLGGTASHLFLMSRLDDYSREVGFLAGLLSAVIAALFASTVIARGRT